MRQQPIPILVMSLLPAWATACGTLTGSAEPLDGTGDAVCGLQFTPGNGWVVPAGVESPGVLLLQHDISGSSAQVRCLPFAGWLPALVGKSGMGPVEMLAASGFADEERGENLFYFGRAAGSSAALRVAADPAGGVRVAALLLTCGSGLQLDGYESATAPADPRPTWEALLRTFSCPTSPSQ